MSFASGYSFVDRCLHYLAFATPGVQKLLGDLENDVFGGQIKRVRSEREVFVTGLPRAGTTLLLELLYGVGEFRTFTYRQMPFVLAPLLWSKVSRPFERSGGRKERAHGDGMEVSFDSPEAFEEIIWLAYLKEQIVKGEVLSPLSAGEQSEDFSRALETCIKKLLLLGESAEPLRYLSKNNANISRIDVLRELFPSSTILVPFRHPLAHVGSLMRQHERFTKDHRQDSFSRRYMKWLGHYEFGENLKPINFNGWLDGRTMPEVNEAFWLEYWTAAYSYVLEHRTTGVYLIDFDKLLQDGKGSLEKIADCVGLRHREKLIGAAGRLRSPTTRWIDIDACAAAIWTSAKSVYAKLESCAL